MLTDIEHNALKQWYSRDKVIKEARSLYEQKADEELEELLHMICLVPLSRHAELPDYMLAGEGKPLFPTNLNPAADLEKWQDAIEVGWEVMQEKLGFTHDDIHRRIAEIQDSDWKEFLARAERRKKEKEEGKA